MGSRGAVVAAFLALLAVVVALSVGVGVLVHRESTSKDSATPAPVATTAQPPPGPQEFCTTPGCVHAAARLLENMDRSVSPCEDFDQFTCGNWARLNTIPEDKERYSNFDITAARLDAQIKSISLNDPIYDFSKTTKWLKEIFIACNNEEQIAAEGLAPLDAVLKALGGWSVAADIDPSASVQWVDVAAALSRLGRSYIISMGASMDDLDTSKRVLSLWQQSLGLGTSQFYMPDKDVNDTVLFGDERISAYLKYMTDVADLMVTKNADDATKAKVKNRFMEIIKFEREIAKALVGPDKTRNKTALYNPMPLSQVIAKYPNIPWRRYMEKVFENLLPAEEQPGDSEEIIVKLQDYYQKMNELLGKTQDKKLIKEYMLWRFIQSSSDELTKELRNADFEFRKITTGVGAEKPRWQQCSNFANRILPFAVGKVYTAKFFDDKAKERTLEMVGGIRTAFIDILKNVPWLDDVTREKSEEKANAMYENIAYPDWIKDPDILDFKYAGLEINGSEAHFYHQKSFSKYMATWGLKRLRKPTRKGIWPDQPGGYPTVAFVNAFYYPTYNSITFPAGILQSPFFTSDGPRSMNYGGIGTVIGHEITHGFDDRGRQNDKDGNLNQWWTPAVVDAFTAEAKCMVDQYSKYSMQALGQTLHVNGKQTLGENIADNGGIKESFKAYQRWVKANGPEKPLPGLQDMTHEQLFFLNFASVWCGSFKERAIPAYLYGNSHSPGKFRTIGTLSNSKEFSEAFNCKPGDKMNPTNKCVVW